MNYSELVVFIIYLICMLGVGVFFFINSKGKGGEKEYFLGGRQMGPWVSALSAGASDMSAWVLMGLPASIYAAGMGQTWIAIGLAIGYVLSWIFMAPRLRKFSIAANDSITIPQYLTNRFLSKSKALQIVCAIIFIFAYTIYSASSIKACGILFNTVLGIDATFAMYIAGFVIIGYTLMGGFKAVCWTDFFQGLLMLGALLIAPIFALALVNAGHAAAVSVTFPANYWNFLSSGKMDWASWADILSGLGWGLGYFGMPHIIIRYMAIRSQKDVSKGAKIGITWNILILIFAVAAGCIGRMFLGDVDSMGEKIVSATVFIQMVRLIFPGVIAGILLSAILAAAMSTADSQLLASASAFAADVYKPVLRKGQSSDKEEFWAGRVVVLIIAIMAVIIASNPGSGTIMSLVGNAWGVFGAAFGPAILLSLFWKRFTFAGAVAGIVAGAVTDVVWIVAFSSTGLYEIIPGFIVGFIVAVVVTLCGKNPGADVAALYETSIAIKDEKREEIEALYNKFLTIENKNEIDQIDKTNKIESKFSGGVFPIFLFCIWAPILFTITLGLATPFIVCTVIRWICNNSTIGGKSYRFKGTAIGLFGRWILWYILTIITIGIYGFWAARNQIRWIIENVEMIN